jgi:ABC-type transporter Mla subunit MlaD
MATVEEVQSQIRTLLDQTESMLVYSIADEWETVSRMEKKRSRELKGLLATSPMDREIAEQIAETIMKVQSLDLLIMDKVSVARKNIAQELSKLKGKRKAEQAYTRCS